jgi:hypothetical protein
MEKLNNSVNLLCFLLIIAGAALALQNPEVGKLLITSGFSAFGGAALARGQSNSNPPEPPQLPKA